MHSRIIGRRVLEYKSIQLVIEVKLSMVTAGLASLGDGVPLRGDNQLGLGVVALRAQHEFTNKSKNKQRNHKY